MALSKNRIKYIRSLELKKSGWINFHLTKGEAR